MNKRFISFCAAIFMFATVFSGFYVSAKDETIDFNELTADEINASLIVGVNDHSRPQAVKVFSVEELDNYINEYHYNNIPLYFDRNKYDASFFEDKLLYFTLVTITGGSPKLEITSLSETTGAIDVEVTIPRWPLTTPDATSWILVLEMDRTKMDKEVSVTTVQQKIQSVGVADNNIIIKSREVCEKVNL